MKGFAGLWLLCLLAIPADASNPTRVRKEKPRPSQSVEPPLALPIRNPPPAPEPLLNDALVQAVLCPERAIMNLFFNRYNSDPSIRTQQLLNELEDLQQAREEFDRFWMNNQPSTLTYDRLNGAIGP